MLDILGESGYFIASSTLCISETSEIEGNDFLYSVFQRTHFQVKCLSGGVVYMTRQSSKRAISIESLPSRFDVKVSSLQPPLFFILLSKNDHFTMHPLKNHSVIVLKILMAFFKTKFDLPNHPQMC